jgi:bacteriocin biosynthesis cyclodehydratase domain-containing protein
MNDQSTSSAGKLKALPLQMIEVKEGVILRRGRLQVKVGGAGAASAVQRVLEAAASPGATIEEICANFAAADREQVEKMVQFLSARRFLEKTDSQEEASREPDEPETPLDIFYWHFGLHANVAAEKLGAKSIAILGLNEISRRLAASLMESGAGNLEVVDYPLLRNMRFCDADGNVDFRRWPESISPVVYENWLELIEPDRLHCVIGTSDFGGQHLLRQFNEFCVKKKINFLPVLLRDLIGYVGPFVVPGETACLECLRRRQDSNEYQFQSQRAAEESSFDGQAVNGYHPSMASIVADIATLEIVKLFAGLPQMRAGYLTEVNLLAGTMTSARVLKLPRCPVCSNMNKTASVSVRRNTLLSPQGFNARYGQ